MLKQLLFSAALATVAISASAESKVLWQSEDPAGKLVGWGDPALTLSAEEAASIKAGDYLTMTVAGVDSENDWPQVALFQGNVGWPPAVNEGVGGKEYPYVASFGVTPEFADSIHAHGIVFKGDGAYVSAVGLKEGTIKVSPYAVWFGPKECAYGNGISIAQATFSEVAPGDKIVVEYDKEVKEHTLQFIFGGWSGPNIATYQAWKAPFLNIDEENGTMTITLDSSLSDLTWGEEGEEQQYDLFTLLKEGGLIMQGPCTVNQVLYIPAPLEYPEEMSFTLNGKEELPGVTVTQEYTEGTLSINVTGECDADEVVMEFATPQGWDGMLVMVLDMGGDFEYAKKAPVEYGEYTWYSLEFAEMQGLKPGNSLAFPVNGEEQYGMIQLVKDEQVYWATIDVTFEVAKAEVSEPVFPETIEYTINGEKELEGVDVDITDNGWGPEMTVKGESDAETIALTFAVPEGWDGWIISAEWAEVSEQPIAKTRSEEDWSSLEHKLNSEGYKKGNTVTFVVEEEANWATLALYKGDKVYNKTIDIKYNVVPAGGGDEPGDEPLIPESIGVTTYAEGLTVEQEKDEDDGSIYIDVTGAIEEEEYEVVLDVPEGWDGYVILPYSENITIGDAENNVPGPRKISATDHDWTPIDEAFEEGYIKGNKLTLKATGNWEFAYAFLYKGEQYDYNAYIGITAKVCNLLENEAAYKKVMAEIEAVKDEYKEAVEFIQEYNPGFDITEMQEIIENTISEAENNAQIALNVANEEGEAYFYPFSAEDIENLIIEMKRPAVEKPNQDAFENVIAELKEVIEKYHKAVSDIETAYPEFDITDMKEIIQNAITEAEEGAAKALYVANEYGEAFFYPFSTEDIENIIDQMYEDAKTSSVSGINAAENANYYDLQGNQIAKPAKGMYVKVVDGKATKVVVK